MDTKLSIVSYNSQGSGLGRTEYINKLLVKHDFIFIQEHWLYESQFNSYQSKLNHSCCHIVSGMSGKKITCGRPYGGCAIIWKNSLAYNVCKVTTPSNRICAVQFAVGNATVLLCCVYMPTGFNNCDNIYEYNHIVSELTSVYFSIDPSYCIVGGDFNVDVRRPGVCQESIKKFMFAYNFSCSINSNSSDNIYTFKSKSTRCTSVIDYFLCSCS